MPLKQSLIRRKDKLVPEECPYCATKLVFLEGLDGIGTWAFCPATHHTRTPGWHIYELVANKLGTSVSSVIRESQFSDYEVIEAEAASVREFIEDYHRIKAAVESSSGRLVDAINDESVVEVLRYLSVRMNRTVIERMSRILGVLAPAEYQAMKLTGRIAFPRNSVFVATEVVPGLYSGGILFRPMFGETDSTSIISGKLRIPGTLGMCNLRAIWESDPALPVMICDPFVGIELMAMYYLDSDRTPPVILHSPFFGTKLHDGLIELMRRSGREYVLWCSSKNTALLDMARAIGAEVVYAPNLRVSTTAGYLGAEEIIREMAARAIPPNDLRNLLEGAGTSLILPPQTAESVDIPSINLNKGKVLVDTEGVIYLGSILQESSVIIDPQFYMDGKIGILVKPESGSAFIDLVEEKEIMKPKWWRDIGAHNFADDADMRKDVVETIVKNSKRVKIRHRGYDPSLNRVVGPGWLVDIRKTVKFMPALAALFGKTDPDEISISRSDVEAVNKTRSEILAFAKSNLNQDEVETIEFLANMILSGSGSLELDQRSLEAISRIVLPDDRNNGDWLYVDKNKIVAPENKEPVKSGYLDPVQLMEAGILLLIRCQEGFVMSST